VSKNKEKVLLSRIWNAEICAKIIHKRNHRRIREKKKRNLSLFHHHNIDIEIKMPTKRVSSWCLQKYKREREIEVFVVIVNTNTKREKKTTSMWCMFIYKKIF
jgi:hypothetical protein